MSFWGTLLEKCPTCLYSISFITSHTRSNCRIGPHDYYIQDIIVGSLLGDSYAEKRYNGTRVCFQQEAKTVEYLDALWKTFANAGYCKVKKPIVNKRISKEKIRYVYRFKTWTFSSFNFYRNLFYDPITNKKIISQDIEKYLTPLAFAVWIMDDGTKSSYGLRLCTNCFTYQEHLLLCNALKKRYNLKCSAILVGNNQYNVRIHSTKQSMLIVAKLLKPYYTFSQNKIDFDKYSL